MHAELIVEPIDQDILSVVACMLIDAQVFPAPSVQFCRELISERSHIWVARLSPGAQPIGFAAARREPTGLSIVALAVDPAHHRRGAGRALLRHVAAEARLLRIPQLTLQVAVGNDPALSLYDAEGFVRAGVLPSYYPDGQDAFHMVLPLRPPRAQARRKSALS